MKKLLIFLFLAFGFASCNRDKITVWVASPWERVLKTTPKGELKSAAVKAAANEYEPFRIIIHNDGKSQVTGLNVSVSNLENAEASINSKNVRLYRANYVKIEKPSYATSNPSGWYPDPLIPFLNDSSAAGAVFTASPFSIDTLQNVEIWCDLFVPKGTKPGIYQGNVYITKENKRLGTVPVKVEVFSFELPDDISMQSHFGSFRHAAGPLKLDVSSQEYSDLQELFNRELLANRAVPATPENVWPEWDEKKGLIENGESERIRKLVEEDHFNALDIPFRYNEQPAKCRKYLSETAKWLKNLGYIDLAYVYMEDEPNTPEQYEIVRKQGALIKSADPVIGRMCTEQTITSNPAWGDLYGAVNIWCPLWGLWDEKTAAERLAAGEKLWSYTALCQCSSKTPWWQIDMEPLNFRAPMWISWNYDITGFLYWTSVYWEGKSLQDVWTSPVFRNEYWGEGILLYPGEPAGIKGFVPSMRLKLYREAEEDYEYMVLASKIAGKEEVTKIVKTVATSFQDWNHNREKYDQARQQLADIIIKSKL